MCGIVGLLVKNHAMRASLGELMLPMLLGMGERGPDSAGLAVFSQAISGDERKFSLYAPRRDFDWIELAKKLRADIQSEVGISPKENHATLVSSLHPAALRGWVTAHYPELHVLSVGRLIEVYKDTGTPAEVAQRYDFKHLTGSHLVGHTRMATESAVTPAHAHPFTAGEDFCLVHNGSLSNPYSIRRKLEHVGIRFETDNDSEAACRFLEWRMREGDDLESALRNGFEELDGFFTFLMGTRDKLALVRDAFACKPAVVAETDDYVAISSEYRSLAKLPDVKNARLFEPAPEELYVWKL
ncbi:MAG: class II glutamine amidotransferase [Burkholderiales bacterium]